MKSKNFNGASSPQRINECLRGHPQKLPVHSKGKPGVSAHTTKINVRFAATSPVEIKLRLLKKIWEHKPPVEFVLISLAAPAVTATRQVP
jgi:hypothetical protein